MLNDNSYLTFILTNYLIKYLAFHLLLLATLFFLNIKDIAMQFRSINKNVWIALAIIFLLAFYLRLASGIAFQSSGETEWEYSSLAKHLTKEIRLPYMTHLYGYPFILSLFFRIFGADILTVFYFNVIIGSLSVILVFLFTYALFKKCDIALFSSLILAILPKHIYFSRVGASENISLFLILFALIILIISTKINTAKIYLFAFSLLAYAGEIKAESLVLIVVFAVCFLIYIRKIATKRVIFGFLVFIILSLPVSYWYIKHDDLKFVINKAAHLEIFGLGKETQYPSLEKTSSFKNNLKKLFDVIFDTRYHNLIILSSLFISFLVMLRRVYLHQITILYTILFVNLATYLITIFPLFDRYIVIAYSAIVPLAGLGFVSLIRIITNKLSNKVITNAVYLTVSLILIFSTFSVSELINPRTKFYKSDYSDINEIIIADRNLDANATVVCCGDMKHCNFLMPGRKVITIGYDSFKIEKGDRVFYIKSALERASGCKDIYLNSFVYKHNLSYYPLSDNFRYIKIFEVT